MTFIQSAVPQTFDPREFPACWSSPAVSIDSGSTAPFFFFFFLVPEKGHVHLLASRLFSMSECLCLHLRDGGFAMDHPSVCHPLPSFPPSALLHASQTLLLSFRMRDCTLCSFLGRGIFSEHYRPFMNKKPLFLPSLIL